MGTLASGTSLRSTAGIEEERRGIFAFHFATGGDETAGGAAAEVGLGEAGTLEPGYEAAGMASSDGPELDGAGTSASRR